MMLVSMVEYVGIAETFLSIATAIILMCYPVIPNQGSGMIYPGSRELARQIHMGWTHNWRAFRKMGNSDTRNGNDLEMSLQISEMREMDIR